MGIYDNPTKVAVGGTGNLPATNEKPIDMHRKMLEAEPSLTPLTVILGKMGEDKAFRERIDWIEKKEIPTTVIVAASESTVGTSISVVANGQTLVNDTLLYNARNDDLRRVDSDTHTAPGPTGNTITVVNSQGGKTSTVWQAGDVIHVLLPAIAENDTSYRNVSVSDQNVYNYQQLCKLQYAITQMEDSTSTHFGGAGSKRNELKTQKFREYKIKKEKLTYFGGRASSGTAPATRYMAGGYTHYLRSGTLYKNFNGIMTETGFRNFVGDYKDQNPDATEVWYYCAGSVMDIISDFGADKVRLTPMSKKYGLDIYTYISRGIKVNLVALPLLDAGVTKGWGYLLDMTRTTMKPLDRDTFYPWDRNKGQGEIMYDTYRGIYSLMVANESRHAMSVGADL